jgi:hypothetical protein
MFASIRFRRQTLDGKDPSAVCLHGQEQAGTDGLAIKKHRAAAAYSLFTAQMSTGEPKLIAQEIRERRPGLD